MTKAELEKRFLKAERLLHTKSTTGWKDIEAIITEKITDARDALRAKENPEARGAWAALEDLLSDIESAIQEGSHARRKYQSP